MVEALEAALNVLQAVGASNEVGKVLAALAAARKGQGEGHNVMVSGPL